MLPIPESGIKMIEIMKEAAMNDSQKFTNVKESVSDEEWRLRCDLAACYRYAADQKWDDLIFTHFSVRLPGKDKQFLINPFGVLFEEITASNLVKIDIKGKPLHPTPYIVNPAGFVLHSAIHSAREDAHCIIHLHTPEGIAVAAQKEGLLPISQTALSVFSDLAYHDYEGIVFDAEEKERLIPNIAGKNCILLRNHGLLATGKTIAENIQAMETVDDQPVVASVDNPRSPTGGLAILRGNLAPEGAVIKVAGHQERLYQGPARVFDQEQAAFQAIQN
ncbi:MAG: class II aldolase/adducin family protein, partial [Proteobacteria bacterium]|nr:class II aldolase/adducin family protein [Pseudomonadota bacterium]